MNENLTREEKLAFAERMVTETLSNRITQILKANGIMGDSNILDWSKISNEKPPVLQEDGERFTYVLESIDYEGAWGKRMDIDPAYFIWEELSIPVLMTILDAVTKHFNK